MPRPAANPDVAFDTIHRDDHILIVAKARGRVTAPGLGHERDSLLNGVLAAHEGLAALGERRGYGLLHRLDRATSGLVVFALTAQAYDRLREAFASRAVEKTYLALVERSPPSPKGTIRRRLKQVRRGDLKLSIIDPGGVETVTHWQVLGRGHGRSLLECRIETGRLHQIRAHLAALGSPVVGDTVYGASGRLDTRASVARAADRALLLHAWRLSFRHPARAGLVEAEAPLPEAFRRAITDAGIHPDRALQRASKRSARPQST